MKKLFTLLALFVSVYALISFSNVNAAEVTLEGANAGVQDLFEEYYNKVTYTKHTTIYVDKVKIQGEVTELFHGKQAPSSLEKTTYYTPGRLYMDNNSGYKTNGTNMDHFKVVEGEDVVDYSVNGTTMETYYVTLEDFVSGKLTAKEYSDSTPALLADWEETNGIYYTENADVLDAFRLFTAPLWLNTTSKTTNYITYDLASVQVKDCDLIMSLLVLTDTKKLASNTPTVVVGGKTYYAFSQAVINKGQILDVCVTVEDGLIENDRSIWAWTWKKNTAENDAWVKAYKFDVTNNKAYFKIDVSKVQNLKVVGCHKDTKVPTWNSAPFVAPGSIFSKANDLEGLNLYQKDYSTKIEKNYTCLHKITLVGSATSWNKDYDLVLECTQGNENTEGGEWVFEGEWTFAANETFKVRMDGSWDHASGNGNGDNYKVTSAGTYKVKITVVYHESYGNKIWGTKINITKK